MINSDMMIQFALSLRHGGPGEGGSDLLVDIGAGDQLGLTARISRHTFCNFTAWCTAGMERQLGFGGVIAPDRGGGPGGVRKKASGNAARPAVSSPRLFGKRRFFGKLKFAIVIKGPLLTFTQDVIEYYGTHLTDSTAVIFSHTNGSCYTPRTRQKLRQLKLRYRSFAYTINPEPSHLGLNYRNVQRESTYFGTRLAVEAFGAEYIFMQRADSVFQKTSMLSDLEALLHALPPPTVPMPGGRVGLCPMQFQLTDAYGRFHLDDHCMFGRPEALLHYWSLSNSYYASDKPAWSAALNPRRGCSAPSVESDNGFIWAMDDHDRRGLPLPLSTRDLIAQRGFIVNPVAWEHLCRRKRSHNHLLLPVNASQLSALNVLKPENVRRAAPLGVNRLCVELDQLYNCSLVDDAVGRRTDTPKWPCYASNTRC